MPQNVLPVPAVPAAAAVAPAMQTSSYGVGKSLQKEISYAISRKGTEDLYKFKGSIADFPSWKKSMVNHFAQSCQKYRPLIDNIGKQTVAISKTSLATTMIDGFNAWEIAIELESFTTKFLSTDILGGEDQKNLLRLCGGE